MSFDFKDLEIINLNMENSGFSYDQNMMTLCFDLCLEAPRDWRKQFTQEWSRIRRKIQRNAVAYRNHVCIECNEDEVQTAFNWLKEAVSRTNQRYREYLEEKARQPQPETERRRLEKLRQIRSSLGFYE